MVLLSMLERYKMKKLLLVFFLLFNISYADFTKEFGYETNYKEAIKKAKKQKKDIVLVLISDYCPWCDKLKEEVLGTEYTEEIVDKHYISLMLNSSQDKYPEKFDTRYVPTIHFVSYKDESIIESVVGFNANYRFYEIIEEKEEKKD